MGLCTPIPNKSQTNSLMGSICYNLSPTFGFNYTHITPRLVHYYRHFHSTTHSYPNLMPFFTQHVQMQQIPTFRFYLHRSEPNALFFICVLGLSTIPSAFLKRPSFFKILNIEKLTISIPMAHEPSPRHTLHSQKCFSKKWKIHIPSKDQNRFGPLLFYFF